MENKVAKKANVPTNNLTGDYSTGQASKYKYINLTIVMAAFIFLITTGCNNSQPTAAREGLLKPFSGDTADEAKKIVRQSLSDQNPQIRGNAIEVVATTKQIKMMPRVTKLLQDPVAPVRFDAALAVGDTKYLVAKDKLANLLKDENRNVRLAAAYAMYRLGETKFFEDIQNAVSSSDPVVRANAAYLLGKTGNKKALKTLYVILNRTGSNDKVLYVTVEAIARLGDERIYPKLWAMMISAYSDVKTSGVKAMGALGTEKAKDAITTMLDDPIPEVRIVAAEQLGKLSDNSGQKVIHNAFRKNLPARTQPRARERIKVLSALAIGRICSKSVQKYLPRLLRDHSARVKLAAAQAVLMCSKNKISGIVSKNSLFCVAGRFFMCGICEFGLLCEA